jgi:hypothetical protein
VHREAVLGCAMASAVAVWGLGRMPLDSSNQLSLTFPYTSERPPPR